MKLGLELPMDENDIIEKLELTKYNIVILTECSYDT